MTASRCTSAWQARCPIESYGSLRESGVTLEYARMRPGDCIVFGKRTLHMTGGRRAAEL